MSATAMESEANILPEPIRRRGQRRLIGLGISGVLNGNLIGQTMSLFLLAVGASPFHLGLLATMMSLNQAIQLPSVQLMRRYGKVSLMIRARIPATVGAVALAALAFTGEPGPTMVWLAIAMLAARTLSMGVGNVAWWPLVRDNTAGSSMPAFIARMRMGQRACELVLPLAVGWHLGTAPSSHRFGSLYVIAIFTTLLGALFVRGISERTEAPSNVGLMARIKELSKVSSIRRYFVFVLARHVIFTSMLPFFVVVLTERGMTTIHFVWMGSVLALGQLLTLYFWGRLAELHESRAVLTFSLLGSALLGVFWLLLPAGVTALTLAAVGFYFLWGVLEAGLTTGLTVSMMKAVPVKNQAEGFALVMYASAIGGAAGGLAGGILFEWTNHLPDGRWIVEPEILYLVAAHAAIVILVGLMRRLEGYGEQLSLGGLVAKTLSRR